MEERRELDNGLTIGYNMVSEKARDNAPLRSCRSDQLRPNELGHL